MAKARPVLPIIIVNDSHKNHFRVTLLDTSAIKLTPYLWTARGIIPNEDGWVGHIIIHGPKIKNHHPIIFVMNYWIQFRDQEFLIYKNERLKTKQKKQVQYIRDNCQPSGISQ